MANKAIVKRLQQSGNLEGLMEVLRYPPDAELREAAAQALGKLLDFNAVENLIRSTLLDSDLTVQKASRQALDQILGNRAQGAIDLYPVDGNEKETWLRINPGYSLFSDEDEENFEDDDKDDEEYDEDNEVEKDTQDEDDEEGEEDQGGEVYSREEELVATAETGGWLGSDLSALVTILRTEGSVSLRVRAARALAKIGKVDMKAVDALAATALWSDSPSVRAAATESLVKLFGDKEADEVLHTYRAANGSTDWGDDFYKDAVREDLYEAETGDEEENNDLEENESGPAAEPVRQELPSDQAAPPKPLPYAGHPPVVQDESSGKGVLVVLVMIVVLVLVVLAFYLGIFK